MNPSDRDAVIEECARWFEARYPMMPVDEMRNALKSQPVKCVCGGPSDTNVVHRSDAPCYCKSQPAQPAPMGEALRLARDELKHIIKQWPDSFAARGARSTLAAIDDALKGDN